MKQNSITSEYFSSLYQVGIIVKDVDATIAYYSSIGIEPFRVLGNIEFDNALLRGKPEPFALRIAYVKMGQLQLELLQPLAGESTHKEYLQTRGGGVHHIAFLVNDREKAIQYFLKKGVGVLHRGDVEWGGFTYLDTVRTGGTVIELSHSTPRPGQTGKPKSSSQATNQSQFGEIKTVGIIVQDLGKTTSFYSSLGMGQFQIFEYELTNTSAGGKFSSLARVKSGVCQLGRVTLEITQPLNGKSIFSDFLECRGEGLHHVGFESNNLSDSVANMAKKGISIIQSWKSREISYTCLDTTREGGLAIEFIQGFKQ